MIYDRTQKDIDNALAARHKIQIGEEISEDDILALERGTFSVTSINRIETAQSNLHNAFISSGYICQQITNKVWEENEEIFTIEDLNRIIQNDDVLKRAFYPLSDTPKIPNAVYHFNSINDIEKILYDLDRNYQYMVSNWRECGTFECGV